MAKSYTYTNISDQELSIPGVGMVKPGEEIKSSWEIYNANLELVADGDTDDEPSESDNRINVSETETK